jgi:hypothetical protein
MSTTHEELRHAIMELWQIDLEPKAKADTLRFHLGLTPKVVEAFELALDGQGTAQDVVDALDGVT